MIRKLRLFLSRPLYDKLRNGRFLFYRLKGVLVYKRAFKAFGSKSAIYSPTLIVNPRFIHIGSGVVIQRGVRLEAVVVDPNKPPEIYIGNNVNIEQDVSISATGKIYIGDNVGIGARSTIIGSTHPFFDVHDPLKISARLGGIDSLTEVGDGCFLGVNSVVQVNVKLGRYVVVGASSVVKKSFPDYCVIEGNPATMILAYDAQDERWKRPPKNV